MDVESGLVVPGWLATKGQPGKLGGHEQFFTSGVYANQHM